MDVPGARGWRRIDKAFAKGPHLGSAVVYIDVSTLEYAEQLRHLPHHVVIVAGDLAAERTLGASSQISVADIADPIARQGVIEAACELSCARYASMRRWRHMTQNNRELDELLHIGMGLMTEHDRPTLLHQILQSGRHFTQSDGAGLFVTETAEGQPSVLRLELYEFESLPDLPPLHGSTLPIDNKSIIGHAALTGEPIVVDDAYKLPKDAVYEANQQFDSDFGYYRRSMLIVPMLDQMSKGVGVLVFINRKSDPNAVIRTKEDAERWVVGYTPREVRLARSLAGEAAVAIENARLYARIEQTLESFVRAAVSAIDQRDPTTAGHSIRVAALTTELAAAVDREDRGPLRNVHFTARQMRELRFAALLHDFGKVSVRDDVLLKAKKLPPALAERVRGRFDLIHRTLEAEYYKARLAAAEKGQDETKRLDAKLAADLAELDHMRHVVNEANEPTINERPASDELLELGRRQITLPDGTTTPYLTTEELHYLSIRQGTLDEDERAQVEAHVSETYAFLAHIPWTEDLKNLATFAYGHHEKLTGVGYPRGLHGSEIPIQTRMITIADMFDALTEADRPYKPAVSAEKAIETLQAEAEAGRLDTELVRLMAEAEPYRRIIESDWRSL